MRPPPAPEDFVGTYGPTWRTGVLSEMVDAFTRAGGAVRPAASGSGLWWAVPPGELAVPVVCSELVWVNTEDGPVTGRCGEDATRGGSCAGHRNELDAWAAMTEPQRALWERGQEAYR